VQDGRTATPSARPPVDLTTIAFPVLAVNGEFDAPISKTQRMQRELKDFRAVILPGHGHNTVTTAGFTPRLYIDTVAGFVRENDAR
jgi:pimeloyl-ACP methyl ester carboxylesterase